MRARSCAQPSRHSNGSARPPGAVQRAHRPLQPTPDDPTGGPTREIRRRAATWSWRRQRPVEPTGHVRSTSPPRCEPRSAIQLRVRPSGTSHPAPAGASPRACTAAPPTVGAIRDGRRRWSRGRLHRQRQEARCHGRFRPSAAAVNGPSDRQDHGKEASETGRLPAAAGSRVRRSLSPKTERRVPVRGVPVPDEVRSSVAWQGEASETAARYPA
jgi:hypothetical protein